MTATLTGRRVTRLAKILVDLAWWTAIVLTTLGVLFFLIVHDLSTDVATTAVRVSIPDHAARELLPLTSSNPNLGAAPELTDLEGMLEIRAPWWIVLFAATTAVAPTVVACPIALHLLRAFL